jgi:hypothetical protein
MQRLHVRYREGPVRRLENEACEVREEREREDQRDDDRRRDSDEVDLTLLSSQGAPRSPKPRGRSHSFRYAGLIGSAPNP